MKKLMVLAVGICMAVVTNAAAINWSASAICDPVATAAAGKNTPASGWLAYCVLESDLSTITTALSKNDTSKLTGSAIVSSTTTTKGAIAAKGGDVEAGSTDFYTIVLNSSTVGSATKYYVSNMVTATVDASLDTTVAFGSQGASSKVASNWKSMSPDPDPGPEPTSGLLLVLGMAGLALRRRRA